MRYFSQYYDQTHPSPLALSAEETKEFFRYHGASGRRSLAPFVAIVAVITRPLRETRNTIIGIVWEWDYDYMSPAAAQQYLGVTGAAVLIRVPFQVAQDVIEEIREECPNIEIICDHYLNDIPFLPRCGVSLPRGLLHMCDLESEAGYGHKTGRYRNQPPSRFPYHRGDEATEMQELAIRYLEEG